MMNSKGGYCNKSNSVIGPVGHLIWWEGSRNRSKTFCTNPKKCSPPLSPHFSFLSVPVWICPYLDGRLWKVACLTPIFLWFCLSFCDLVHIQGLFRCLASGSKSFWMSTKSQNDAQTWVLPVFSPVYARIFAKTAPIFLQKWARLKN